MKKYIILELMPTSLLPQNGEILQLSALKVDNFQLTGRFDKRIVSEKIPFPKLEELIDYDKESFTYEQDSKTIMESFKVWAEDLTLLIIDNEYTKNYLNHYQINNQKASVFELMGMSYNDNVIGEMIKKYNLEPSNYIVDLIFEALLQEENAKLSQG